MGARMILNLRKQGIADTQSSSPQVQFLDITRLSVAPDGDDKQLPGYEPRLHLPYGAVNVSRPSTNERRPNESQVSDAYFHALRADDLRRLKAEPLKPSRSIRLQRSRHNLSVIMSSNHGVGIGTALELSSRRSSASSGTPVGIEDGELEMLPLPTPVALRSSDEADALARSVTKV